MHRGRGLLLDRTERLSVGGFSPLRGFLGKADYARVVGEMRLADGHLWPLPVTLPVAPGEGIAEGKAVRLIVGAIDGKPRRRRVVREPTLVARPSTGPTPS